MKKSGAFLLIFLFLLGFAVVPVGPASVAVHPEKTDSVVEAAVATSGTLKIPVAEDVSVINGSYANDNFDGDGDLHLGTAIDSLWIAARCWFKFDLSQLPKELSIHRATMNVFMDREYITAAGVDEPVGVYHCSNNNWDATTITWNNQPSFSATPTSIIDSPASPNMFIPQNWYSWEVSADVLYGLANGKTLTEVLKLTVEVGTQETWIYPMKSSAYPFNATYLEIEYTTPTTSGLSVDGITSGPLLDYINNPNPELGWTFADPDYQDFQKDYDVEVWNNMHYNDTLLWHASHESVSTIHNSYSVLGNWHPFGSHEEFRMQMKYPSSEIPRSGIVDKLYFTSTNDLDLIGQLENFEISLLLVPSATSLSADFYANREGRTPTIVLSRDSYELSLVDNMIEVDIENTFMVNKDLNLIIEIRLTNNTGDKIPLARTHTGPGSAAYSYGTGAYFATTAGVTDSRTYDLKIGYLTQTVYSGIPATTNRIPFHTDVGYPGRFQIKYNQSYVNRVGYLDRAFMRVDELSTDVVFENFTVTLVESPIEGPLGNDTWTANYGGATSYVVLDSAEYTLKNLGGCLVIDFDNIFYYTNTHDLLIDIQWDNLVSGQCGVLTYTPSHPAYRAWDVQYLGSHIIGNGTASYDLMLDFVNDEDSVPLEGCITLVNATEYYWRVRTCDSTGVWGDWTTHTFKYEISTILPTVTVAVAIPSPVEVNQEVTVSVNATHAAGIYAALFEYDGSNHSMTAVGDTYSFSWTPTTVGEVDYTIYVRSNENTWASVSGSVNVTAASTGIGFTGDVTTILIIVGLIAVVIVIIVIKKKKK